MEADRRISAPALAKSIEADHGIQVCPQTVRNVINSAGYKGRVARKRPKLSVVNIKCRLDFGRRLIDEPLEAWGQVVFCDESKLTSAVPMVEFVCGESPGKSLIPSVFNPQSSMEAGQSWFGQQAV